MRSSESPLWQSVLDTGLTHQISQDIIFAILKNLGLALPHILDVDEPLYLNLYSF